MRSQAALERSILEFRVKTKDNLDTFIITFHSTFCFDHTSHHIVGATYTPQRARELRTSSICEGFCEIVQFDESSGYCHHEYPMKFRTSMHHLTRKPRYSQGSFTSSFENQRRREDPNFVPESKIETLQDVCSPRNWISKDSAFRELLNDALERRVTRT